MTPVRPNAMSPHAWWIYLVVFGSGTVVFHFLPWSVWCIIPYVAIAGARSAATLYALRRHAPPDRVPWRLLVGATAAWTIGELFQAIAEVNGTYGDAVHLADMCFVAGYAAMATGLFRLGRSGHRRGPANGLIDGAIMFVAFAVPAWAFLVTPTTLDHLSLGLPATLRMLYPVMDLVLISMLIWMGAAWEVRTAAHRVMILSLVFWAASNAAYHLDSFSSGTSAVIMQDSWLTGHVLWGVAMLMPSLAGFWAPRDRSQDGSVAGRLAMLLVATMSAPVTLVLQMWRRTEVDVVAVAVGGILMAALSSVRLRRLIHRMGEQSTRLEGLAQTDFLTGLPNRRALTDRLQALLDGPDPGVGVLVIDLDRFKGYNDTFGHRIGDELLIAVARRWSSQLGPDILLARTGGDEFTAIVPGAANDTAYAAGRRVVDSLVDPVVVSNLTLAVDASVGVSVSLSRDTTAVALLHQADVAMYVAKTEQAQVVEYCDDLDTTDSERFHLLNDLRGGIERGELTVHFQPQLDLATGRVSGVEALVRWFHPERGAIPPCRFIPAAEKTGLIRAITRLALHESLAACRAWRTVGVELRVGVNVSSLSLLDGSFVGDVAEALDRYGLDASSLELEVTESSAMVDIARATAVLDQLSALGVRLAIDDFGTGYSSLEYLHRLPITVIKIDQSFVTPMSDNSYDETIVRSTIGLAMSLGMGTVAEGVEDLSALDTLRSLGCDTAQGYAIARPMPGDEIVAAITTIEATHRRAVVEREQP